MKTIGLIGGTGWISTSEYYTLLNEKVNKKLGGNNFARIIMYSFNFGEFYEYVIKNDYNNIFLMIKDAAQKIESAGAECIVLCANTLHMYADRLKRYTKLPIIHIAEAVGEEITSQEMKKAGLLGTLPTMEHPFYREKLKEKNIETLLPDEEDRKYLHSKITNEMVLNKFTADTKNRVISIIEKIKNEGAEGIILGCTELPILLKGVDIDIKLFDTIDIHTNVIVDFVIS